ncbi:unnamed protein product [marine sediment metagenome]|uniref:Uncharacterized protein n=1 Tax=marine sediment metagenome TaxID=412755 RepID=X0Y8P1_9ZZZZ
MILSWCAAMARALRIEYEGAFYHVTARGNKREMGSSIKSPSVKGKTEKLKDVP